MHRFLSRPVSALALALAAGIPALAALPAAVPSARLKAIRAEKPALAARAMEHLASQAGSLGLGASAGFQVRTASTSPSGRTVVRLQQTHQGHRVWGAEAIAHVEPDGQIKVVSRGLDKAVALATSSARLSAADATTIALRNLAPKGSMPMAPKVELVVFPTVYTGGIATRVDPVKGVVWDRAMSILAKAPSDPYVLAYQVRTMVSNRLDGHKEMSYIIDANSGAILRKWNDIQSDAPAQGTGSSYFRGNVSLSTSKADDGTYSLVAQDRGTLPQPYFAQFDVQQVGLSTCFGLLDMNVGWTGFDVYHGVNTTNQWGDGHQIPFPYDFNWDEFTSPNWWGPVLLDWSSDGVTGVLQGALAPVGETSAVDCHFGLSATWDFYRDVFGRDGIDDKGSSTFGVVHQIEVGFNIAPMIDNAYWSSNMFGMVFGEGTYGTPWAASSYGMLATTELDITGHEVSHGVTEYSAGLIYSHQSGGLNEASSDIMGKMVQAYTNAGLGGTTIPDFATGDLAAWEVGHNIVPVGSAPLRYMYKPSLDGVSADGWFDGIDLLDVHYSSGPVNRFYYFLTTGASSSPSSVSYSPYYPAGMTGIGNDKAAHIWYKALTEYMTADTDLDGARTATDQAAIEIFGEGSPEELAVLKAWSAVNVGLAPGESPKIRVTFPEIFPDNGFVGSHTSVPGILQKVQIFPAGANVRIACDVANTTNKGVTFTTPKWHGYADAGTIGADGTWTTPNWSYYEELLYVQGSSQADPSQFAQTAVIVVDLDADTDTEVDAIDLGTTAMSWYKDSAYYDTPRSNARVAGGGDWDIAFFTQAFNAGFAAQ